MKIVLNTSLSRLKFDIFIFLLPLGSHQAKMNNTPTSSSESDMIKLNPLMSVSLVVMYWCLSMVILIFCVVSAVAMKQTKRTPYAAKLLSLGLLTYHILFLVLSSVSKLFDYNDSYPIWHAVRGFQIAAQLIVGCMSLERLFVLKWPYVYLRVMTERRTKLVCSLVIIFAFLQFAVYRGSVCYTRNKALNCGPSWGAYLITLSAVVPVVSFVSFIKIFKIIHKSEDRHRTMHSIRQYKGTVATFLVLVNTTISQIIWVGLSVLYFNRSSNGVEEDGLFATLADWGNLLNCIVDPLIYVMWFNETRMQFFKMFEVICPYVRPKIEQLRVEIYQLDFHPREPADLVVEYRAMDPEEGVSNPIQPGAS